jgi:hypothetical protein
MSEAAPSLHHDDATFSDGDSDHNASFKIGGSRRETRPKEA